MTETIIAPVLRPYQSKLIEDTCDAARRHKRVLVQLPTGGGKSVIFAELIRRAKEKGRDTLFLVHRRELIYQAAAHLERVGVQAGIIMAGEPYHPAQVQLASRDTLSRRLGRTDLGRYGLVVYDECHHSPSKTSMEILSRVNGAHVIGFTATPIRKGGQLLGDVFDAMVCGPTIPELQSRGFLCDTEYMSLPPPDLSEVETSGGDYTEKGLQEKAVPKLIGGVVDHYLSYGGKKGIIFSCGQKHSYYLREDFARHGRAAIVIDSRTPDDERKKLEADFRSADTGILINCGIFTEGYDLPDCDTLVLARPTKSLGLYLQMAGRGLRPAPGKRLLIIDHGANVYRHGFVEDAREWSLEKSKPKDAIQQEQSDRIKKYAACPECGAMITGKVCGTCGHEVTNLEIARNVRELKHCGLQLVAKKIKRRLEPRATPAQWRGIISYCALKGWRLGTAAHRFKARFGVLPWEARLGVSLPRGDEWKMGAREWLEMTALSKVRYPGARGRA